MNKVTLCAILQNTILPSSRFRLLQYTNIFAENNIETKILTSGVNFKLLKGTFIQRLYAYVNIISNLVNISYKSLNSDVIFIQREIVPTKITIESILKHPVILDVDDAIWIRNKNIDEIAKRADAIIAGNDFIRKHFVEFNRNIFVIPTAVNTEYWMPYMYRNSNNSNGKFIIGWSGSGGENAFKEVLEIEDALVKFFSNHKNSKIFIMSNEKVHFKKLKPLNYELIQWSKDIERDFFNSIDLGIMPLRKNEWNMGKCGYKLLLYMSMGKPVIASPVGVNRKIIEESHAGFLANNSKEWLSLLEFFYYNKTKRREMGENGRKYVEVYFSLRYLGKKIVEIIKGVHATYKKR